MRPCTVPNARAIARPATMFLLTSLVLACSDANGPNPGDPYVSGRVMSAATGHDVSGAEVSAGGATQTTDASGRFVLRHVPDGPATLHVVAAGFENYDAPITVVNGSARHDVQLARIEAFAVDDFALYVPKTVDVAHGVLLALGGPDTRAFATGVPAGAPIPEVEASLQTLGQDLRTLAAEQGLAILGTSRAPMPDGDESDALIDDVLHRVAELSGHSELASPPLLLYGLSGGAPEASGFAARNPARAAGLFLKVPVRVATLTGGEALKVPTFLAQAELDAIVDNVATTAAFTANRKAGALWALAMEPGVAHHSLTPFHRQVTLDWFRTIAELRLPYAGDWGEGRSTMADLPEASGWLGDPATAHTWAWPEYPGSRDAASWLPSELTASEWAVFRKPPDVAPGTSSAFAGVYDLTARVETSDMGAWNPTTGTPYEPGTRWTTTITIQHAADSTHFTGTYSEFRATLPDGREMAGLPPGTIRGTIDASGHVTLDLYYGINDTPEEHGVGMFGDGKITGSFSDVFATLSFSAARREVVAARGSP